MPLPNSIAQLIENYAANRSEYRRGDYNETQTRIDYVNPLFAALGWDMDNHEGLSELHREVIHEDKIKIGGRTKAPDYSFRAGGDRKFFLETKRPTASLDLEQSPAYQIRRYGWTAKLPLSILTNFEEFAVYDTRVAPEQKDSAKTARLDYFRYTDYAEKWDELAARFSRDAVFSGAFDRYAEEARAHRITVPVDKAFLAEISGWRVKLAQNIVKNNPSLGSRELNYAVQMIIDRLIFLRISEDRGAEPDHLLQPLMNRGGPVYPRLLDIFRHADARYNSGLFHFGKEAGREGPDTVTPHLTIDDRPLKEIIASVYYPESPFEFSVFPADILGQVYEQFLGKVIRVSGQTAEVEDKPEVKKAGGVYYTPTYIVDYIVRHTVGKLVDGCTPAQVSKLTVLDPACGSGSFLIGAYQFLLDWHLKYYLDHDQAKWAKGKSATVYLFRKTDDGSEVWRLTTAEKKRILLNNIYGVDIDTHAVEVTKLSLLLKVLEGESAELIDYSLKLFKERALPDLEANIKCGNSLIGPDFYTDKDMALFDLDAQLKINTFDWKTGFPKVMKAGGFDAVIGNPPYVRQEILGQYKDYFKQHYSTYHGVADLYVYFIERGYSLLKEKGVFSVIVGNKWARANYGKPLRQWLKSTCVSEITDFGGLPVFVNATTYVCILQLDKKPATSTFRVAQISDLKFDDLSAEVSAKEYTLNQADLNDNGWPLGNGGSQSAFDKISNTGVPLKEYVKGKIYRGIVTGYNKAFVIDADTRKHLIEKDAKSAEVIKPYLAGKDIKRYQTPHTTTYLMFTRRGIQINEYPAIKDYLHQFKEHLLPRPEDWQGEHWGGRKPGPYKWYEIQDTTEYHAEFLQPKILWPGISSEVTSFAYDEKGYYGNDNNQLIVTSDKYVLGVLNSKVSRFMLKSICDKVQGGFYRLKIIYIEQLPIRTIDFAKPAEKAKHDKMVMLVERMLTLHKDKAAARLATEKNVMQQQIEATDTQIDRLVYDLYGLTDDEVAVVEGAG